MTSEWNGRGQASGQFPTRGRLGQLRRSVPGQIPCPWEFGHGNVRKQPFPAPEPPNRPDTWPKFPCMGIWPDRDGGFGDGPRPSGGDRRAATFQAGRLERGDTPWTAAPADPHRNGLAPQRSAAERRGEEHTSLVGPRGGLAHEPAAIEPSKVRGRGGVLPGIVRTARVRLRPRRARPRAMHTMGRSSVRGRPPGPLPRWTPTCAACRRHRTSCICGRLGPSLTLLS